MDPALDTPRAYTYTEEVFFINLFVTSVDNRPGWVSKRQIRFTYILVTSTKMSQLARPLKSPSSLVDNNTLQSSAERLAHLDLVADEPAELELGPGLEEEHDGGAHPELAEELALG